MALKCIGIGALKIWGAAQQKCYCLLTFLPNKGQSFARMGLIFEKFSKVGGANTLLPLTPMLKWHSALRPHQLRPYLFPAFLPKPLKYCTYPLDPSVTLLYFFLVIFQKKIIKSRLYLKINKSPDKKREVSTIYQFL